jgi:hypothetical protein
VDDIQDQSALNKEVNARLGVEYEQERSLADLMEQFRATMIPYLLDYEDRHLTAE